MLKKITAVGFLSLASLVMLAFMTLPHHHHLEYICFATEHCGHHTADPTHSHDEEPQNKQRNCAGKLLQANLSQSLHGGHSCKSAEGVHLPFLAADLLTFLLQHTPRFSCLFPIYQEKLHAARFISNFSGRAPPYFD